MEYPLDIDAPDFKYLGQTKDGLWGKYVWVNDCDFQPASEEERERWRREREIRASQRLEQEKLRSAQLLSEVERDKEIRKLLSQLSLKEAHKTQLKNTRGLTDSQIRAGMYRSVEKFQRLEQEISYRLAGVNISGWSLSNPDSGIICPIFNSLGLIVGWQLRLDGEHEGGRYRWPTSASKKRPHGSTAHLVINDFLELPIAFYRPLDGLKCTDSIGIAEGTGFKPFLTSQRFGQIVLGAAGGNCASSPELFKRELNAASEELLGVYNVTLYADAGAVGKDQVMNQYRRTHELVQDCGYSLQVVWWGQIAEDAKDSDELDASEIENVKLISWEEFLEIAQRERSLRGADALSFFAKNEDIEPDPSAYTAYVQQQEEQERIDEIIAQNEKQQRKKEWFQRLQNELNPGLNTYVWGQSYLAAPDPKTLWDLGYKPNQIVNQRYLNLSGINASFLAIVSAMNTGKTHIMAQQLSDQNTSVLIVTNTIALAESLALRYNCRCYNEPDINLGECTRLVITADSLWKIPTYQKRFQYVLLDEANQVIPHTVSGSTCKRNRERIINSFTYFVATCNHLWLADADLSGTVLDWVARVRQEQPFVLLNTYKPCLGRVAYRWQTAEALFEYGCTLLESGRRVLFVTDSKTTVKKTGALLGGVPTIQGWENLNNPQAVSDKLKAKFPDKIGQTIHGDNSGDPEIRNFIKHINESLTNKSLDYLIFNSSLQSGISIDIDAFDEVICLYSGYTLCHPELAQLAHRYRPEVPINFWINEAGLKGLETNCYKIASDYIYKNQTSGIILGIDPQTGMMGTTEDLEFLQLIASLEARRNWSLTNIGSTYVEHLEGMGYQVIAHPDESLYTNLDSIKQALDTRKEIVTAAERATICKSKLLLPEQAESLRNKPNPEFAERCALLKYELHDFYGMEVTEELIEKDDGGMLRKKLTRLELLLNSPDVAKRMDYSDRRQHHVVTDLKHYTLVRQLLSDLGLQDYIDPLAEYSVSDLVQLGERARLKAVEIKKILGITIPVAPRWLRSLRTICTSAIKALFGHRGNPVHIKWILSTSDSTSSSSKVPKQFASFEEANEFCRQLSPLAQLLIEAFSVEKRFKATECPDSKVHALLCDAVGLKRETVRETRTEGVVKRITVFSWDFAMQVIAHREQQRQIRFLEREQKLAEGAKRFKHLEPEEMQAQVEQEIAEIRHPITPALVFAAMCSTASDTPAVYIEIENLGGCRTEKPSILPPQKQREIPKDRERATNMPVTKGAVVRVSQKAASEFGYKPLGGLTSQGTLLVEQLVTGRDDLGRYNDYLLVRVNSSDTSPVFRENANFGGCPTPHQLTRWLPAEWLESREGFPIRRDPDSFTPQLSVAAIGTWRNWLLGVRSVLELEAWERQRKLNEISEAITSLTLKELTTLQQQFQEWGMSRDWLPMSEVSGTVRRLGEQQKVGG